MGQTEIVIFTVLITIILLSFIAGIIAFTLQYRKKKLGYESEKKAMEQKYKADLLHARLQMHEITMKTIGEEIHDNVGQKLTLASLYAQQMGHANKFPEIKTELETISNILNESLNDLRKLSKDLTYPNHSQEDLINLIEQQCQKINGLDICNVSFSTNIKAYMIPSSVAHVLLRLVQEFFQNSLKHSNCKNLFIIINNCEDELELSLTDDGNGFDILHTENNIAHNGIGLKNIKARAALLGASAEIKSETGKGTSMIVKISHSIIQHHQ